MFKHRSTGKTRIGSRKRRAISPSRRLYRGLNVEGLEDRLAPAVQVFSGLEFMTTGTFNVSNNVVTTSSPVEVGVAPAAGGTFTPLLLLQSGVEFNSTDSTGTFSTPPTGGSGAVVSAYAAGTTVSLLDAQALNFEAPALLSSSSYDVLSGTGTNSAELGVAGGSLSVTVLRFNGSSELDVQGNLSFSNFAGLTLGVGGSNYVALTSSGVSLTGLSITLPGPTSFSESGLDFTATNLQVTYSSSNNEFDLSGSATLTDAGNTFDLTLGSASDPGLVIENGSLASLDATVSGSFAYGDMTIAAEDLNINATAGSTVTVTGTASVDLGVAGNSETLGLTLGTTESGVTVPGLVIDQSSGDLVSFDALVGTGLAIGGFAITSDGLELDYDSTTDDFSVSGAASFMVDNSPVSISLAAPGTNTPAGLVIEDGQLTSLDATLSSTASISVAGMSVAVPGLTVDYQSANGGSLAIAGDASFMVGTDKVDITLGTTDDPGLLLTGNTIETFDATINSNIVVGGMTIQTNGLTVDYQSANGGSLAIAGDASFMVGTEMVDITLGTTNDPGLLLTGNTVLTLDATINSNIVVGGMTIQTNGLTVDYQSANGGSLAIAGDASFMVGTEMVDITLGTTGDPGLLLAGNTVETFDATINSNIDVGGMTIQTNGLTVDYQSANGGSLAIAGGASFMVGTEMVDITLGTTDDPGLLLTGNTVETFDATINSNIDVGGMTIQTNGLTVDYQSANGGSLAIAGDASFMVGTEMVDITLGTTGDPGLLLAGNTVETFDATINSNIDVGGMTIQTNGLTVDYQSANGGSLAIAGDASFMVGTEMVDITLGTTDDPGLLLTGNTVLTLDATINSNIVVGGMTIQTNGLTVDYQSANGGSLAIAGGASFMVGTEMVDITLGTTADPGLLLAGNTVLTLDATINSNIVVGGMTIQTNGLTVDYQSANGGSLAIAGDASFMVGTEMVDITLGTTDDPGLLLAGNTVLTLDATINSNITVAGLSISTSGLMIDYQSANGGSLDVSGMASFSLATSSSSSDTGSTVYIQLGNSTQAGLVMDNGQVEELNATITSNISIAGLTIDTKDLTISYAYATDGDSLTATGTAWFVFDSAKVSIMLGGPNTTGLVIRGGQLYSLDASVSGNFDLLGIDFQANSLGVEYQNDGDFAMYGGVSLTSSFLNFSTMLGTEEQPGLVIDQGSLQSLDIAVSGGFSLFGFQVEANGLAIQYSGGTNELELSGGIMLDFTSVFEVSAGISQGGLFINTQTGRLSIPSTGLQITASATLGPFSIQNLMISFSNGPSGVNFSASGAVDLPGGIDVDLTQLVVQNGQLDDIGISVTAPIPIGDTGFFIDSLSGSLDNLNNVSQLVVSASAQISFGDPIPVPSLGPIFAGGNFYLVEATGSITVSASELDLSWIGQPAGWPARPGVGIARPRLGNRRLLGLGQLQHVRRNLRLRRQSDNHELGRHHARGHGQRQRAAANPLHRRRFAGLGQLPSAIPGRRRLEPGRRRGLDHLQHPVLQLHHRLRSRLQRQCFRHRRQRRGRAGRRRGTAIAAHAVYLPEPVPGARHGGFGAVATGEQISVTSPILDGDYPVSTKSYSATVPFSGVGQQAATSIYLPQSYVIMSTLSFTVTVQSPYGTIDIGNGSFNSQGQLLFTPDGSQGIVPTSAFLFSNGELELIWPAAPYDAGEATISANYNAADAYFELLEKGSGSTNTVVGLYTIDPVDNDPYDSVQTAQQANLIVPQTAVNGIYSYVNNQDRTVYTLAEGQAVPQTVSFNLYSGTVATGGTLLGTGTFNASGALAFVPNGEPSIVPTSGYLGVDDGDPQGYIALSLSQATASTYMTVTYSTIANRVIDFQLPSSQSSSSTPAQYTIELVDNTSTPLPSTNPDEVPDFSETTLYQTPTVSFASGSVALSSSGILSGTVLASAYTPQAVDGSSSTSVSIYYNTTDSTAGGTLIDSSTYNPNSANSSGLTSYPFSFPGFANLTAGSYYVYAIINDGQNAPVTSSVAGPFTEASPTPVLSGPSYLALSNSDNAEQGVFSAADNTALGITTNFVTPVNVNLSVSGGGTLTLPGGTSASQISKTYLSAAAAVTALSGLMFDSSSTFTGATTMTFAVSTTINGTTYNASNSIALLTPNTPLEVTQTVDSTVPSDPSQFNLTVTVTNNPNGPDAQNGTEVQVLEALSPGLAVVSATPSEGAFNETNGVWSIGNLPLTGTTRRRWRLCSRRPRAPRASRLPARPWPRVPCSTTPRRAPAVWWRSSARSRSR